MRSILILLLTEISIARLALLIVLLVVSNGLEVIGLSLIIPVVELLQGDGKQPSGISQTIMDVIASTGVPPKLHIFLLSLTVMFIAKAALTIWLRHLSVVTASQLQHQIRTKLFASLLQSRVSFVTKVRQGDLLSVLGEHIVRVSAALFMMVQLAAQFVATLGYVALLLVVSWQLTLVCLALGIVIAPIIKMIGRKARTAGGEYATSFENLQHRAVEFVLAKKPINAMGWGTYTENQFSKESYALKRGWQWMAFWSNCAPIVLQPLAVVMLSLLIALSLAFHLSVAMLAAFSLAFVRLVPSAQGLISMGVDFQTNLSSFDRVMEMLAKLALAREPSGKLPFDKLATDIGLRNVRFQYDGADELLRDINITLPKGQMVALVGPSGSGKTTVADLLLGLDTPSSGSVVIDGQSLAEIDLTQFRKRVAYVPQESVMFFDTIRENLTVGLSHPVDDSKIRSACEAAGAWKFISEKPRQLDEVVGDRGTALSGGQRQRLALARALLREPELLILDEATSALDQDSEQAIQQTLQKIHALGNITTLVIAHRYTTITQADQIYELRDGVATNLGTWEQAKSYLTRESESLALA